MSSPVCANKRDGDCDSAAASAAAFACATTRATAACTIGLDLEMPVAKPEPIDLPVNSPLLNAVGRNALVPLLIMDASCGSSVSPSSLFAASLAPLASCSIASAVIGAPAFTDLSNALSTSVLKSVSPTALAAERIMSLTLAGRSSIAPRNSSISAGLTPLLRSAATILMSSPVKIARCVGISSDNDAAAEAESSNAEITSARKSRASGVRPIRSVPNSTTADPRLSIDSAALSTALICPVTDNQLLYSCFIKSICVIALPAASVTVSTAPAKFCVGATALPAAIAASTVAEV